jgi:hypothetical protein
VTHGLIPSRLPLWAYVVAAAGAFVAARAAMAGAGSDQPAAGEDPAAAAATGTSGDSLWDTFAGVGTATGAGISGGQFSQVGVFPGSSSLADLLDGGIPSTVVSPPAPTPAPAPTPVCGPKPLNLGAPGSWICTNGVWGWHPATSTTTKTTFGTGSLSGATSAIRR